MMRMALRTMLAAPKWLQMSNSRISSHALNGWRQTKLGWMRIRS